MERKAEKPPDRLWVIIRYIETGWVHYAGWAVMTNEGYVFEGEIPPMLSGTKESDYKYERQPAHNTGAFW